MQTRIGQNLSKSGFCALALIGFCAPSAMAQQKLVESAASDTQTAPASIQTAVTEGYVTPELTGTKSGSVSTRNNNGSVDIWVADIDTFLDNDKDYDGYFAGLSVSMDIDVDWDWADVYAQIYLQRSGRSPRLLHVTQVFSIYEQDSLDRYQVAVDLLDNTPAGHYDLLIDVIDARTGYVVDSVSNSTHSNLQNLPLESDDHQSGAPIFQNDVSYEPAYDPAYDVEYEVTYGAQFSGGSGFNNGFGVEYGFSATSIGHRGAAGWLGLFGLSLAAGFRTRFRRRAN